ncbi:MAG TPA: hypothetical protein VK866_06135 [Acidimicrobiales bacterium]|nr:hypothetical protein [Acidimicrobiales bacterium]
MLLWFAGLGFVSVVLVFRSPALDYRMVVLGSVLPLVEALTGGPKVLHTLLGPVVVLTVVMLATRNRRLVRRRWLGLPIGLFVHLVLDASWADRDLFWWPAFGWSFPTTQLPELERGLGAIVVMELIGAAAIVWSWRRFGLDDPARRELFVRHGRLDRALVGEGGGS